MCHGYKKKTYDKLDYETRPVDLSFVLVTSYQMVKNLHINKKNQLIPVKSRTVIRTYEGGGKVFLCGLELKMVQDSCS